MNRENAKALLPIITAYAEGKTIQFQHTDGTWGDRDDPMFNGPVERYRAKPEPKKLYVIRRNNGEISRFHTDPVAAGEHHERLQRGGMYKPYTLEEYVQVLEGDKS